MPASLRLNVGILVALASASVSAGATADEALRVAEPAHDAAAAEALFRDGRERMEAQDYARACTLFAESRRLDDTLGTLFNLAACEEKLGKLASAWQYYCEVVDRMALTDERRVIASERKAALDREVPRLTVSLAGWASPQTHIMRDGAELSPGTLGIALPVEPGTHEIVARAPDSEERRYVVALAPSERRAVIVAPGPTVAGLSWGARKTTGYVVGGIGLASLAVGAFLGVRALERRNDSNADCSGSVCRDASGAQAYSDARSLSVGADVALGIGLVAVVVGGCLAWIAPSASPAVGLRVTPSSLEATF